MNYLKAFHLLKARRSDVMGKQGLAYLNAFGVINKIFASPYFISFSRVFQQSKLQTLEIEHNCERHRKA